MNTLLEGIVDYAGLFPPAGLPMDEAVGNYAVYRRGSHRAMLGAFVVPAARLDEFEAAAAARWPGDDEAAPAWPLSVLLGTDLEADVARARRFDAEHRAGVGRGRARVAAFELRVAEPRLVSALRARLGAGVEIFVEWPWEEDPRPWAEAVAAAGLRAKIRTGGVQPENVPPIERVAAFLRACVQEGAGFKATAGLHHPLRAEHALTYEPHAPRATMHGFLNVFAAACFLRAGKLGEDELVALLSESDPAAFELSPRHLRWREHRIAAAELRELRRSFARSFGSCSFTEPVDDLKQAELT